MNCPSCGGTGAPMGTLGNLKWYRCIDCGWEFSRKVRKAPKRVKGEKKAGKNES